MTGLRWALQPYCHMCETQEAVINLKIGLLSQFPLEIVICNYLLWFSMFKVFLLLQRSWYICQCWLLETKTRCLLRSVTNYWLKFEYLCLSSGKSQALRPFSLGGLNVIQNRRSFFILLLGFSRLRPCLENGQIYTLAGGILELNLMLYFSYKGKEVASHTAELFEHLSIYLVLFECQFDHCSTFAAYYTLHQW